MPDDVRRSINVRLGAPAELPNILTHGTGTDNEGQQWVRRDTNKEGIWWEKIK